MVCSFGSKEDDRCNVDEEDVVPICGEDAQGLVYRQHGPKVRCNVNGQWESVCDYSLATEPLCVTQPCSEIEVAHGKTITYSTNPASGEYNEGTEGNLAECNKHYVPSPGNNKAECEAGKWSVDLECELKYKTCTIDALKDKLKAINIDVESLDNDAICPGAEKMDAENIYGGEKCSFQSLCITGYASDSPIQVECKEGEWENSAQCIEDNFNAFVLITGGWGSSSTEIYPTVSGCSPPDLPSAR